MYKRFSSDFTVYYVSRKPNLPSGYSIQDMSEDYVTMIKDEIEIPVDIIGLSSGGPIAQHFVVDHPEMVDRLVLAETGYALSEKGKQLTRRLGDLLRQGKWRTAAADQAAIMFPRGVKKLFFQSVMWLLGKYAFGAPTDLSDGLVEIEAEDKHDFEERLGEIKVPTLIIGGAEDPFYPISETATGIPNAKKILYEGLGHDAIMKRQFNEDVLAFLNEDF